MREGELACVVSGASGYQPWIPAQESIKNTQLYAIHIQIHNNRMNAISI